MKTVYFATTNAEKVREAQCVLDSIRLVQIDRDVPEIKTLDMSETIERKAEAAYALCKKPILVEDTGFFLDAYPGFPGTYTKFCVRLLGLPSFLKLLDGKVRTARFETWVAHFDGKKMQVFKGVVRGHVARKIVPPLVPKLPYDALFIPAGQNRTYSQMGTSEKAETSHRAKAFRALEKGLE